MQSFAKRFRVFAVIAVSFFAHNAFAQWEQITPCLLYTSPSPRD